MKKSIVFLMFLGMLVSSCSKDEGIEIKKSVDYPVSELDNSSAGIYVGLSNSNLCYFVINLKNGGDEIKGIINVNGTDFLLTPEFTNYESGSLLTNGEFSFDQGSVLLSVDEYGKPVASLKLEIEAEYSDVDVFKSKSNFPVHIYTGTRIEGGFDYEGTEQNKVEWSQTYFYNVLLKYEDQQIFATVYEKDAEEKAINLHSKQSSFTINDDLFSTELLPGGNMVMTEDKIYLKAEDENFYFEVDLKKKL